MSHVRQQIRDQVVTTLTGLTTTGANVWASRVYPLDGTDDLPGLTIHTGPEEVDEESSARSSTGMTLVRNLDLIVTAYERDASAFDDNIDLIAAEVEAAIGADPTLNSLAKTAYPLNLEPELSGEGDQPIGKLVMTFRVVYVTDNTDAETAL